MARSLPLGLVLIAFLTTALFVPGVQGECPKPINDCGISPPLIPGVGGNRVQLTIGAYNLVADLNLETESGAAKEGAVGNVSLRAYASSFSAPPVTVTISLAGALGVSWIQMPNQASDTRVFQFTLDPASSVQPSGSFDFQVNASGSSVVLPIRFTVQEGNGPQQERAGVLTENVAPEEPSLLARWALPSLAGLVVGFLLSLAIRRRTR